MNYLTPTSSDPVARARALGPAIEAAADEIERTQRIPEPLLSQLHEARICRMLLPRSVDGDEIEPWVYLRALEEISRHDGSVGWNVFVANSSALIAPFLPPESAREIFSDPTRRRRLGAAECIKGACRARWLSRHRAMAIRLGLPAGDLDGRSLPGAGAGRRTAPECRG